ncbi:MAG TPA: holo-ACP synthase [Steroidobacter sp.]|uniref:holo-ACP synthase n=1 Tax=Steroidobacter sp. TaxID=1978227 RepID=UPI002ED7F242
MIFGIGTDIVQIQRIERLHEKYGEHFIQRLLLPAELDAFRAQTRPARFLAMRFAAKEAIVKAMGTGFAHGIWIRDVGVAANEFGRPGIIWSERGQRLRERLGIGEGHITLTDEAGLVVAVAVLMCRGH